MAASVLRRSVSEEEKEAANRATESQVAGIFSSFRLGLEEGGAEAAEAPEREAAKPKRNAAAEGVENRGEAEEEGGAEVSVVLEKPERKTRRVQLVMTESVYRKSREMAGKMGMSLNDYIHTLLARMGQG